MKAMKKMAAAVLGAALLLTGCGSTQPKIENPSVVLEKAAYSMEDYETIYRFFQSQIDGQLQMMGMTVDSLLAEDGGKDTYHALISGNAMQQLLLTGTLENLMKEEHVKLDQKALEAKVQENQDLMGGKEEMNAALAELNMTRDQFARLLVSPEIMIGQLTEHYGEDEKAMTTYYNDNFLRAKHVLINEEEGSSEKEAQAKDIAEQARNGADFDQLVKDYGQDPGMIGSPDGYTFTEGEMVQEFYEGTKALEINEISDPIRTNYGWHVIQRLPLGDLEGNLQMVRERYMSSVIDNWIKEHEPVVSDEAKALTFETLTPIVKAEDPADAAETEGTPAEEDATKAAE